MSNNLFCYIDDNYKNYEYFQKYCRLLQSIRHIDLQIHYDEICQHLNNKQLDDKDKLVEEVYWVQENGENFRTYLNTIKIIYITLNCKYENVYEVTWDEFKEVSQKINKLKGTFLDNIF